MENQFKVNKRGQYYNIQYIGYKPHSVKFDVWYWNNSYCSSKAESLELMDAILKLEKGMEVRLKEMGLNYNPKKIIRMFVKNLEPILIGIDIRAKLPFEDKVQIFINFYHRLYTEAFNRNEIIFETIKEYGLERNTQHRIMDAYHHDNDIFELDFGPLDEYLRLGFLEQCLENIDDSGIKLEILKKKCDKYFGIR